MANRKPTHRSYSYSDAHRGDAGRSHAGKDPSTPRVPRSAQDDRGMATRRSAQDDRGMATRRSAQDDRGMATRRRPAQGDRQASARRPQHVASSEGRPQHPGKSGAPTRHVILGERDESKDLARARRPRKKVDPRVKAARRKLGRWRARSVRIVAVLMAVGCIAGFSLPLRPTASTLENRNLTTFPELSVSTLLDGQFFTDLSLWYADTFPGRDVLVGADKQLQKLYGIQPKEQLVGGNRKSDALPVAGQDDADDATQAAAGSSLIAAAQQAVLDAQPKGEGGRAETGEVDIPAAHARAQEMESAITDGIYVADGACYTLYYFDKDATQHYADVISDAANQLDGVSTVYSVLLPTNAGVMLSEETLEKLGVPNQEQAIDYFYSCMNDKVVKVETFDVLKAHNDEYLYFRTDHHWTQLAAYYVYESQCTARGVNPAPYDQWQKLTFQPFWGEYGGFVDIKSIAKADYVEARVPQGTNTMEYWTDDLDPSTRLEGPVITDLSDASEDTNKYNCFVCGNRPLSHIHNPKLNDGSSCLVIKDSFGNPFTSVLVDSYEDVYTLDFRYSSLNIVQFAKDYGIKDVIFENVLMFAGTYNCSDALAAMVSPANGYRTTIDFEG